MEKYWDFNDTLLDMTKKTGLENLLAWISNRFDRELTHDFNNSSFLDFHTNNNIWTEQLASFSAKIQRLLQISIKEIAARQ
jgi:hypothetical protein